ncbi:MAG TPA: alpha/beta fold hydrolase [Candidatus Polarisedimenticolaceae bacterium]|nr:alpha/beta fold hydrolase [Candidatus Polarisedimenticolaceae bacterium]
MKKLLLAAGVLLAAVLVGLWTLGSILAAPAPQALGPPPRFLEAAPVTFPSASGSTLHGWLVRGTPGAGAVVLAHGVRANRLQMVERAAFLKRAGYSVLLFDEQAHGESPGAHITFGYLEARDARAAVGFLRTQLPGEPIAYLGVSQGGAAALLGAEPLDVQALVLESVYPTLRDAVTDRIEQRLGVLGRIFAPLLLVQVEPRLGVDPAVLAPIDGMARIHAPLLLLAGDADRHTPLEESLRLFAAAPQPKRLWVVPGAAHVDLHRYAPREYERQVLEFLEQTLRQGAVYTASLCARTTCIACPRACRFPTTTGRAGTCAA